MESGVCRVVSTIIRSPCESIPSFVNSDSCVQNVAKTQREGVGKWINKVAVYQLSWVSNGPQLIWKDRRVASQMEGFGKDERDGARSMGSEGENNLT